jgi:Cohesin domain
MSHSDRYRVPARPGTRDAFCCIAFSLACFLLSAAVARASVLLTAGSTAAKVGDVFTIPVLIANAQGVTSFQFDLTFDPSVVEALAITDLGTDFASAAEAGGGLLTGITGLSTTRRAH